MSKIVDLNKNFEEHKAKTKDFVLEYVKAYMEEYQTDILHVHCYTPSFNDGDPCTNHNVFMMCDYSRVEGVSDDGEEWFGTFGPLLREAKETFNLPDTHLVCQPLAAKTVEEWDTLVPLWGRKHPPGIYTYPWDSLHGTNESILFVRCPDGSIGSVHDYDDTYCD